MIMPVYNSGKYLSTAVDSILDQDFTDIELILVDDGSTDGSGERCDEYAQKDERVVVIHQKNQGICNARNRALDVARGEYIGFSDHDDEFAPGAFSCVYKTAVENDADIVKFQKIEKIFRGGTLVRTKTNKFPDRVLNHDDILADFFYLKNNNILNCIWDGIFRKEMFETLRLDTAYKMGGEDLALMYDLIVKANRLVLIDKIFYYHYIRRGFSTSTKWNPNVFANKITLANKLNDTLNVSGINRDDHPFEYSFYLVAYVYFPIINNFANKNCTHSYSKKIELLEGMLASPFTPEYFLKQPVASFWKKGKKYGLGYYLLSRKHYWLLFKMFSLRGMYN